MAAAKIKRDSCSAKMDDSIRQLRRYLDARSFSTRILLQKCDKVDVDREELVAKHHQYGERAQIDLDDPQMVEFIAPKIDAAVDIVDEATLILEELNVEENREKEDNSKTNYQQKKDLELLAAKLEVRGKETLLSKTLEELDNIVASENPIEENIFKLETTVDDIHRIEEDIIKSWNSLKMLLTEEVDIQGAIQSETNTKLVILRKIGNAKSFISQYKATTSTPLRDISTHSINISSDRNGTVKLQKMEPPKFSGNIRNFAIFKADFESVVMPAYDDPIHQVYVLKETCLQGSAYKLVRNLEKIDEIWSRLSERYGDSLDIVDSVIKDLQDVIIPKFNQDEGLVNLVDVLEKGIQDLSAIDKRNEIANAYTVKLIEQKLPRRVMQRWLEEEDRSDSVDRFEKLFTYLKLERKRTEKIIQQRNEMNKDTSNKSKNQSRNNKHIVNHVAKNEYDCRKNNNNCLIHQKGNHLTRKCKDFLSKTAAERGQLVKELDACKLCLSLSHIGKSCPWESKWDPCKVDGCKEYHSRLVHGSNIQGVSYHIKTSDNGTEQETDQNTLLLIQNIKSEKGEVLTFWDNGSTISLVSKKYARSNKLKGVKVSYELVTVGNIVQPQETLMHEISIKDRCGTTHMIKAYEIDDICLDIGSTVMDRIVGLFTDLKTDDVTRPNREVELLIGMNYAHLHPNAIDRKDNLILYKSLFGTGKVLGGQHKNVISRDRVSAFTKIVALAKVRNIKALKTSINKIDFFTAENFGVNVPPRCNRCKSCKDCKFETHQL